MNYFTTIEGNSYDLLSAANLIPETVTTVVLLEKSCIVPTLKVIVHTFNSQAEAEEYFTAINISEWKGFMKHILTADRFREYAEKINQVRIAMQLDPEK